MRIICGFTDIANITANYAKGFSALGHDVFSVVWNRSYFYPDSTYELVIDERIPGEDAGDHKFPLFKIFLHLAKLVSGLKYDLFILYAPAVLPTHLFYPLLNRLDKKIITAFWGSDIRYWYALAEEMKNLGVQEEMAPFFEYAKNRFGGTYFDKKRTIEIAEKYSDLILSQPDMGQLQTRPYMRANIPLDLNEYEFCVHGREKPFILHAPSVPEAKGTDYIVKAVDELRNEGLDFEFQLIEKMPNRQLRRLLTGADILIDQLYSTTIAGVAAEAMATGNVVLARYMPEFSKVPEGCPVINTNMFTLKDNLREAIINVGNRKTLAALGRSYVETNNDHIKICENILQCLNQKELPDYDFYPTFYKDFSLPETILEFENKKKNKNKLKFFKTLLSTGTTRKS